VVPPHLPAPPEGRTLVLAVGKAACGMALAVERHWPAGKPLYGIALTRYGHARPLERMHYYEASHPLPDRAGEQASREMLSAATALRSADLLLALISGGGSALLALPAEGISVEDLRQVTRELLACGATIQEINAVRKHLSAIQGGRLAAACRTNVLALIISDVTGDDPTHIASGPCAPDPTTFQDAVDVLNRYDIRPPRAVLEHLVAGVRGEREETPKPGDPVFERVENRVIASAQHSLAAAAQVFREAGIAPVILGDSVTGEAREVAKVMAALVRQVRMRAEPFKPPVALISGGARRAGAAAAAASSCSRSRSSSRAFRASTPSPPTPTASTAPRTTPGRCSPPTRSRARRPEERMRASCSPRTTATGSFRRWVTSWSPARPAPTSTTTGRS